jgi:hypothetical protein
VGAFIPPPAALPLEASAMFMDAAQVTCTANAQCSANTVRVSCWAA